MKKPAPAAPIKPFSRPTNPATSDEPTPMRSAIEVTNDHLVALATETGMMIGRVHRLADQHGGPIPSGPDGEDAILPPLSTQSNLMVLESLLRQLSNAIGRFDNL